VLGKRAFARLCRAYLAERPSQSFSLRNLGEALEPWLRQHPGYAGEHLQLALDMVRLEWAHIHAFDGPARKPLGPEDLLELSPELRFSLQPHLTLLPLQYPVDDLRVAINRKMVEHESASNAVAERDPHLTARRYRRLKPQAIHLAVHRAGDSVWYRRLDTGEYRLLDALRLGMPIGMAIESAMQARDLGEEQLPAAVQAWFESWSLQGWLCAFSPG
jgi:hypothetical protein